RPQDAPGGDRARPGDGGDASGRPRARLRVDEPAPRDPRGGGARARVVEVARTRPVGDGPGLAKSTADLARDLKAPHARQRRGGRQRLQTNVTGGVAVSWPAKFVPTACSVIVSDSGVKPPVHGYSSGSTIIGNQRRVSALPPTPVPSTSLT